MAVRALVTPKDTGRTIASLGHIADDADACAGVVPKHGGKPGAGGFAVNANCTLAPDAVAATAAHGEVTADDTRRIAGGRFSNDAKACAGVNPFHGDRPVLGRFAQYANCTSTSDAMAVLAAVLPVDAGRIAL